MAGVAWYRAKIRIPAGEKPLSLYAPVIYTSYQIYADGKLIAEMGGMPPHEHAFYNPRTTIPLPRSSTDSFV